MSLENKIFKKSIPDYNKIVQYGFVEHKDRFMFEQAFFNGEFVAKIEILKNGKIIGKVYDSDNNEEYLPLRLDAQQGAFVGEVRAEYEQILKDICQNCFFENLFIYPQTNRISNLIFEKYNDTPAFMWEKFPGFGIFKNPNSGKWYGAVMNIDRSKLDKTKNGEVEIINVKLDEKEISKLLSEDGFYPAWHMNKKSWITITLDETLSDETILKLVDESYSYTIEPKTEWIVPANPEYYDIENAFNESDEIIWKQSSKIKKGDIVYVYVARPISAILFKCKVIEVNIPYDYEEKFLVINKVMRIKLLKKYDKDFMTFEKLKKFGIIAIRGQRTCPEKLSAIL